MIRLAFEQGTIPIESYVDYYFFFVEKNSAKLKKNGMYRLRSMRIIWIELYVVLLLSSRLKRRKGKERKDYFSSDQISNEIYKYPFDDR